MPQFNQRAVNTHKTVNHENAPAWTREPELDLYAAVCTTVMGDKFYESGEERISRIRELVSQVPEEFVAQLAVYAREEMHLRSIPLVLCVELARVNATRSIKTSLLGKTVTRVIQRADEITELLAYYQSANERTGEKKLGKISNQIVNGIAGAFNEFNEYQFAKYDRPGDIKLRDALFLAHPKAKNAEQQVIFNKIIDGKLEIPDTWETALTAAGSAEDVEGAKRETWERLINEGKLGYMALMRNLRNIIEARVSPEAFQIVLDRIGDADEVARSKQLPFRFQAAYRMISQVHDVRSPAVLETLERAIQASAANIPGFGQDQTVVCAADVSASMMHSISPRSIIEYYDIGLVLSMILQSRCQSVISGFFGDTWKIVQLPRTQILANTEALREREGEVGYSTNGYRVIRGLRDDNIVADKVMIFTDCELWDNMSQGGWHDEDAGDINLEWERYRKEVSPSAKLYLFDLSGYGTTPLDLKGNGVHLISGWSDKVFSTLASLEAGGEVLDVVKSIKI